MTEMREEEEFERLFAAARADVPDPAFAARVLARAMAEQPRVRGEAPVVAPAPRRPVWRDLVAAIGGWRGAGGLTTAMILGFVLGLAGPAGLLSAGTTSDSYELMPGVGTLDLLAAAEDQNE